MRQTLSYIWWLLISPNLSWNSILKISFTFPTLSVLIQSPVSTLCNEKSWKWAKVWVPYSWYSHVHVRLAGSGVHISLDAQVAVILVDGTNIELHLKNISAPSVVLWYGSMEPFVGGVGSLQLTGGGWIWNKQEWPARCKYTSYRLDADMQQCISHPEKPVWAWLLVKSRSKAVPTLPTII